MRLLETSGVHRPQGNTWLLERACEHRREPGSSVLDDGTTVDSDGFAVAGCACHRRRNHPFCDTTDRGGREA